MTEVLRPLRLNLLHREHLFLHHQIRLMDAVTVTVTIVNGDDDGVAAAAAGNVDDEPLNLIVLMRLERRRLMMVPMIGMHYVRRPLIMELMLWLMLLPFDLAMMLLLIDVADHLLCDPLVSLVLSFGVADDGDGCDDVAVNDLGR